MGKGKKAWIILFFAIYSVKNLLCQKKNLKVFIIFLLTFLRFHLPLSASTGSSNKSPIAKICNTKLLLPVNQSAIRLDGGCSYDPDGSIVSYKWDLIGTNPLCGKANLDINHTPQTGITGLKGGYSYTIQLTVTDDEGAVGVTQVKVKVEGNISRDPLESFVNFSDSANQLSNYYLETGEPWSFKISDKFNNPSGRFELRYGDKMMGRSTRSQNSFNQNTDNEVWIGFSLYFPKSWKPDYTAPEIVFAIHTWSDNGGSRTLSPPFCFVIRNGVLTTE